MTSWLQGEIITDFGVLEGSADIKLQWRNRPDVSMREYDEQEIEHVLIIRLDMTISPTSR